MPYVNKPCIESVKAGRVFYCTCGESKNQPYCDGSHKGSEYRPMALEVPEDTEIAFCGCRQSANLPYCDGSQPFCKDVKASN